MQSFLLFLLAFPVLVDMCRSVFNFVWSQYNWRIALQNNDPDFRRGDLLSNPPKGERISNSINEKVFWNATHTLVPFVASIHFRSEWLAYKVARPQSDSFLPRWSVLKAALSQNNSWKGGASTRIGSPHHFLAFISRHDAVGMVRWACTQKSRMFLK